MLHLRTNEDNEANKPKGLIQEHTWDEGDTVWFIMAAVWDEDIIEHEGDVLDASGWVVGDLLVDVEFTSLKEAEIALAKL